MIFFTGFPGFLGTRLLPRMLARSGDERAVCLVQAKFADLARARADDLMAADPALAGRITIVHGDITRSGLGLEADPGGPTPEEMRREIRAIYHLAAVYDLSVDRDLAMRVNVDGTRHMLELAADCPRLERFHYASTCYVSGRYAGPFGEDDLVVPAQTFNNFYEETKFLAEVKVREWMEKGLAATIYRPSIVVGDSTTGETQKYDGPYYVIRWILKQPGLAVMPMVGDTSRTRVNVVPSDFVLDAIEHLSGIDDSAGKTYQLADPNPLTVDEIMDQVARATGKRLLRIPMPGSLAKASLAYVPFLERVMGIPPPAIDYFTHPTYYLTDTVRRDLAGSGIEVPPFASYVDKLVRFVRQHPEVGSKAMV